LRGIALARIAHNEKAEIPCAFYAVGIFSKDIASAPGSVSRSVLRNERVRALVMAAIQSGDSSQAGQLRIRAALCSNSGGW
jgi:hypothetical protein